MTTLDDRPRARCFESNIVQPVASSRKSRQKYIASNPSDSDNDISFVQPSEGDRRMTKGPHDSTMDASFVLPCDDKKCAVHLPALIDTISTNANHFGHSFALRANHAIQTFIASNTESSGEDSDASRTTSHARKVLLLIEKAGRYAADVNPCSGLIQDEEGYSSSKDSRHKHTRHMRKTKASEAKPRGKTSVRMC